MLNPIRNVVNCTAAVMAGFLIVMLLECLWIAVSRLNVTDTIFFPEVSPHDFWFNILRSASDQLGALIGLAVLISLAGRILRHLPTK